MIPFRDNLRAIVAMSVSQLVFILNDVLVKLASETLPIGEIIFVRGLFAIAICVLALIVTGQMSQLVLIRNTGLWVRTSGEVGATFTYLLALFQLPIALATTIFQAVPLTTTAAAAVFLGEPVGWRRWTAIAVGFVGVVIVVRPGVGFHPYALLVLLSVLFVTYRDLVTRTLPISMPTLLVTTVTAFSVTVFGGLMGPFEDWSVPSLPTILQLAAAAALLTAGYYTIILAYRIGDMSVVAPFRYTVVVWAIILGLLVWGDVPDLLTVVGTIIIVATGIYTFYRERQLTRLAVQSAEGV